MTVWCTGCGDARHDVTRAFADLFLRGHTARHGPGHAHATPA